MSWLDRLTGRQPDPTADWPELAGVLPQLAFWPLRLGTLRLGADVEAARVLGRPEEVRRSKLPGAFGLLYTRFGVELDFEEGRLMELTCHLDRSWRWRDGMPARELRLADGTRWNDRSTLAELRARLGEPRHLELDEEDGGGELRYEQGGEAIEIGLGPGGQLASLGAYATGD